MFKWTKEVQQRCPAIQIKLVYAAAREIAYHFAKKSSLELIKFDFYPCTDCGYPDRYAVYIGLGYLGDFSHDKEEILNINFSYEVTEDGKLYAVVTWDGHYYHKTWKYEHLQLDSKTTVIEYVQPI